MRKKLINFIISRIFIVIILLAFLYGLGYFYLGEKISNEVKAMQENRSYAKSFENEDDTIAGLEEDYQMIEDSYHKIFYTLPERESIIYYIEELEVIAEKTDNSQKLVISDKIENQAGRKVIPIEINIVGSYNSLLQYLRYLENLAYFTNINSIKLDKIETGEISTSIDAVLYVIEKDEK